MVRAAPELFEEAVALRLELPTRSAAQIAEIVPHGDACSKAAHQPQAHSGTGRLAG
jgi:hypothetical protein